MERKNAWKMYSEEELTAVEKLSFQYRRFLNAGKTERECVAEAVRLAEKNGYQKLDIFRTWEKQQYFFRLESSHWSME